MAPRTRVHELAEELHMPVKELLAMLSKEGVIVKSGGSTVERSITQRVRHTHRVRSASARIDVAEQPQERAGDQLAATEPEHVLLVDDRSSVVHHRDYLFDRSEYALCGHRFGAAVAEVDLAPSHSDCGDCVARIPEYHLGRWRARCGALESELNEQEVRNGHLQKECKRYKKLVSTLNDQIMLLLDQKRVPPKKQKEQSSIVAQ